VFPWTFVDGVFPVGMYIVPVNVLALLLGVIP